MISTKITGQKQYKTHFETTIGLLDFKLFGQKPLVITSLELNVAIILFLPFNRKVSKQNSFVRQTVKATLKEKIVAGRKCCGN